MPAYPRSSLGSSKAWSKSVLLFAFLNSLSQVSAACDCYRPPQSDAAEFFTGYTFLDFSKVASSAGNDYTKPPPVVTDSQSNGKEGVTSSYFSSSPFKDTFDIQSWSSEPHDDATLRMVNSAANVYLGRDSASGPTYLTLRTSRLNDFQSAAEIDSRVPNILHASIQVRARVRGSAGSCAGIFTYADDTNESDIEFLTSEATDIFHATNQPSVDSTGNVIPEASQQVTISGSTREQWNNYRMDWNPAETRWFVNDKQVASISYSVPREPSNIILNMWSNGGIWTSTMEVGDSAMMDVSWLAFAYNTTDSGSKSCSTVCDVDLKSATV